MILGWRLRGIYCNIGASTGSLGSVGKHEVSKVMFGGTDGNIISIAGNRIAIATDKPRRYLHRDPLYRLRSAHVNSHAQSHEGHLSC